MYEIKIFLVMYVLMYDFEHNEKVQPFIVQKGLTNNP